MIYDIDDCPYNLLVSQVDELEQRKMTPLLWNNIDLISAEVEGITIGELYILANQLRKTCNRVIILALQDESEHLIVTKSANVLHLNVGEILGSLSQDYGGQSSEDKAFVHATFNRQGILPELIDRVLESVVVALP
jgi:alanyl-tRNA synthetase